jgi:hypothetical protein
MLLQQNVHPKIVSERHGHSSIQMTLDTYSHLLPNMQQDAAQALGNVLFGPKVHETKVHETRAIYRTDLWPSIFNLPLRDQNVTNAL